MKPIYPQCSCPNADCPRHSDCDACLENHEGNGYCKRSSIIYSRDMGDVTEEMLGGFFEGWKKDVSPAAHLQILRSSYRAFVAYDTDINRVVGFITAISDGVLCAYIPLLEVLPSHRGKRVGTWLLRLMRKELGSLYMLDICHDEELTAFYARFEPTGQGHSTLFRNFSS